MAHIQTLNNPIQLLQLNRTQLFRLNPKISLVDQKREIIKIQPKLRRRCRSKRGTVIRCSSASYNSRFDDSRCASQEYVVGRAFPSSKFVDSRRSGAIGSFNTLNRFGESNRSNNSKMIVGKA